MDLSKHWNSDRFYIPAITMIILKVGGYLALPWKLIIVCALVAFFGDLICGAEQ